MHSRHVWLQQAEFTDFFANIPLTRRFRAPKQGADRHSRAGGGASRAPDATDSAPFFKDWCRRQDKPAPAALLRRGCAAEMYGPPFPQSPADRQTAPCWHRQSFSHAGPRASTDIQRLNKATGSTYLPRGMETRNTRKLTFFWNVDALK